MPVLRAPAVGSHQDCRAARRAPRAHITTPLTLSVIGCVVNGPGEARETDIGFTGGGNGTHQVYISGLTDHRLKDADIVDHLVELVEKKAAEIETAKQREKEVGLAAAQ
jgi:(E)-4-hydroxy-3-methylbut-2-enyl-diphosphate synthase